MIVQVVTSVTMGQVARSKLVQQLSLNTAKALQVKEEDFSVTLSAESTVLVAGKFGSAAVVTVATQDKLADTGAMELRAGISAALRHGFQIEPARVKFAFVQMAADPFVPK
mmetsp:Transcript_59519/g.140765  ORF Transcript_59519/g.140765 Transcript_59519/m.140765 type:complete len:111 (+) Transcript_59519:110-442(+)